MMAFQPTTTSRLDIHPPFLLRNPAFFSKVDRFKCSTSFVRDCKSMLPLQIPMQLHLALGRYHVGKSHRCYGVGDDGLSNVSITQDIDDFIRKAVDMNFFERLNWAWNILFPRKLKRTSNADIAKQRLKMILFSDRCDVTDDAKRKIVNNIVGALSDFVEIDSEDKVQLNVSADPDLGTVYSVTVPVRRVKPEYQEYSEGFGDIRNLQYKDISGQVSAFDIKLDYPSPNDGKA
jgi:septum formation topological specificity factor MinE